MPTAITKKSKQRRMIDFYNLYSQHSLYYLCVAHDNSWSINPPTPKDTDEITGTPIGYIQPYSIRFVEVITNPTQEQREDPSNIYYNDSYYEAVANSSIALQRGFTKIMLTFFLDKDEDLPVIIEGEPVQFNQLGLYVSVNPGNIGDTYYLTPEQFNSLEDKGKLEIISNRNVLTREADQRETINILLEF